MRPPPGRDNPPFSLPTVRHRQRQKSTGRYSGHDGRRPKAVVMPLDDAMDRTVMGEIRLFAVFFLGPLALAAVDRRASSPQSTHGKGKDKAQSQRFALEGHYSDLDRVGLG
jgi:hypothetical protein